MIITRRVEDFRVFSDDPIRTMLDKVERNKSRAVFVTAEDGYLEGVVTDGDFRRWVGRNESVQLNDPIMALTNRKCHWASIDEPRSNLKEIVYRRHHVIPLLDAEHRLVAIALPWKDDITIGRHKIGEDHPVFVIAEIGNNHNGCFQRACELIDAAHGAGANCVKFQMRDLNSLYQAGIDSTDPSADLGSQYTQDLLRRFQLDDEALFSAFDYAKAAGIEPLCTPWDLPSLDKLEAYGLNAYKVASADFTNHELLDCLAKTGKPLLVSTGMATEQEVVEGIRYLSERGAQTVFLHCNSTYPAPFKDINLSYLTHLKVLSGEVVGYSGHERGIFIPMAAVAIGAKVIEKHFTFDKEMEGNDHKVSLLPEEFSEMVQGIRQVEAAMGGSVDRTLSQGELMNRETLAKSLVAACDIPPGTPITEAMLDVRSPGQGLQPNRKTALIGRALSEPKVAGDYFFPSDIGEGRVVPRNYTFNRPWGVPVRFHDFKALLVRSNPSMLEFHLSYNDLELELRQFFDQEYDLGLVVHAPELFAGDHTLDLCTADHDYRRHSINELQRVIKLTRELNRYFARTTKPCIVTNMGGFSHRAHHTPEETEAAYERLTGSLSEVDTDGVELIAQTMPPFPWHFGGQQFHNLFVDPDTTVHFCEQHNLRLCMDVSHSKLACTHLKISFTEFLERLLPYTAHLHLADARGVDGEGLQIGQGEIDWEGVFRLMDRHAPADASFIPEIWQGHKNGGEGAWLALERLERYAN